MRTATVQPRRLGAAKQAASLPNFIAWPPPHLLEHVRWLRIRPLMSTKLVIVTRTHSKSVIFVISPIGELAFPQSARVGAYSQEEAHHH